MIEHHDLVIVGAGIIGLAAAFEAVEAGLSVRIFDTTPVDGASFAAAGMIAPTFEAAFGEHALMRLNVASAQLWPEFARRIAPNDDLGFRALGTLTVAFDSGDLAEARRLHALHLEWGLKSELMNSAQVRERMPLAGPRIAGGLWAPDDHQINPRRVCEALIEALARRGCAVERHAVVSLEPSALEPSALEPSALEPSSFVSPGRWAGVSGVRLDDGSTVTAQRVLLAAGWQTGKLVADIPDVELPTRPVKGEVVRLNVTDQPWLNCGFTVRGLVQGRPVYIVPRADGEVVVGATTAELPDDRQPSAGAMFGLLRDARAIMPGLDEAAVREFTARARPGSPDNLPMIGPLLDGSLLVATGHYRHGILLAAVTALLLRRVFAATPERDADPASGTEPTTAQRSDSATTADEAEIAEACRADRFSPASASSGEQGDTK
ncbi:FAD-dependent oxidoreductase [Lysinibacter cavernae]|uniref:Glycine oxidase n=1 Tax=Lysinibacter cavernae TaxID=1640652 RepID=A0A7X5TT96_9MICO|nr:FAD-dependent oxidoreductase [Lysinibacter cavernae]NIH53063.1 glycine oxidase [Lysinibacter cavernae]